MSIMLIDNEKTQSVVIPNGFIVFLSGVPGVGKTTLSYELLQRFDKFRIIEETDLIREVLRGYNDYLKAEFGDVVSFALKKIKISEHGKLLNMDEAKEQCLLMKSSLEQIVNRQQRKGIASIINGVHIIPEVLDGIAENKNIIYINLYVTNESILYERLLNRNSLHMLNYIPLIFKTNNELYLSTEKLTLNAPHICNIDVTLLNTDETIEKIISCISKLIEYNY